MRYNLDNVKEIVCLCKELKVKITLGSDAHFYNEIGDFLEIKKLFLEVNFPKELIISIEFKRKCLV